MRELWEDLIAPMGIVVLVIAVFMSALLFLGERATYISAVSEIESLRADLPKARGKNAEDVLGQATQWNQSIARKKRWNRVPVIGVFVPDGWERIEPIEIPKAGD